MSVPKSSSSSALHAMATVVITTFVVAVLYIGRDILIPLALAALLAFLLSPLVRRLERWIGRIAATILAVTVLFVIMGGIGWVLTRQVLDLATRLPDYQENIRTKLRSLKVPGSDRFTRLNETLDDLKKDLPGAEAERPPSGNTAPAVSAGTAPRKSAPNGLSQTTASGKPTPVEIVETGRNGPMEQFGAVVAPLLGPLGTRCTRDVAPLLHPPSARRLCAAGLIRLSGAGNISATTRGMDDAAQRVARYLLMQLIVNATYGVVIWIGLYFIGVPNAFVWGVLRDCASFYPVRRSLDRRCLSHRAFSRGDEQLDDASVDHWLVRRGRIAQQQRHGTHALRFQHRRVFDRSDSCRGLLDLALGSRRPGAGHSTDRLPGGDGTPRPTLGCPFRAAFPTRKPSRRTRSSTIACSLQRPTMASTTRILISSRRLTPISTIRSSFPALTAVERDAKSAELETEQHTGILQELRDIIEDLGLRPPVPSQIEAGQSRGRGECRRTAHCAPGDLPCPVPARAGRT
jgi:hypothetical protein